MNKDEAVLEEDNEEAQYLLDDYESGDDVPAGSRSSEADGLSAETRALMER